MNALQNQCELNTGNTSHTTSRCPIASVYQSPYTDSSKATIPQNRQSKGKRKLTMREVESEKGRGMNKVNEKFQKEYQDELDLQ